MARSSSRLCAAVPVLLTLALPAADLIVDPGNPAAFQTLQAALDAASPGDRILLAAPISFVDGIFVRTSVTIEPLGPGRAFLSLWPGGVFGGEFRIESLAPGLADRDPNAGHGGR